MGIPMEGIDGLFQGETPLKTIAATVERELVLPGYPGGTRLHTPDMQGTIWGRAGQATLSLLKTDVIDRRIIARKPRTLAQIVKGAFSEANRDLDDMPHHGLVRSTWGVLDENGGRRDDEMWSQVYPFPCQKPVGQIIFNTGHPQDQRSLSGKLSLATGMASVQCPAGENESLQLDVLMSMSQHVIAVQCKYANLSAPLGIRLYRHQDQGHRAYMDAEGAYLPKEKRKVVFTPANQELPVTYYDLEADRDINGPFDPPECGMDGRFFWVSQRFPSEATFPEGFHYVMMGLVDHPDAVIETTDLQMGLGAYQHMQVNRNGEAIPAKGAESHWFMHENMKRAYALFKDAPGKAADARMPGAGTGTACLYVAVVTSNEAADPFAEARRLLLLSESKGFEALAEENRRWYDALYDKREDGRIALLAEKDEKDRINRKLAEDAFRSWAISDGGHCDPDPRKYEGSEVYVGYDMDTQSWHSLPCYNEVFSEPMMVWNRHEPYLYYCRLVEAWHEGLRGKAREIYDLPGIVLPHGYLPPIKPNPWYMENQVLDLCLDVSGQVMKTLWNMWDYRADENMLATLIYPAMRDLAIFYEAFARRNWDGVCFHLAPVVETENWGISYQLKYATDTTGALAMVRKVLRCAMEGAMLLGVDEALIPGWDEVASHLAPYPTSRVTSGEIMAGNPGAPPRFASGDHPFFTGTFPLTLADEVTLDSPQAQKDVMIRTLDVLRPDWNRNDGILLGMDKDHTPCCLTEPAREIRTHEELADALIGPSDWMDQTGSQLKYRIVHWPERPGTERLLNSRSGRIHLFPCVPDWAQVAFRNFQARGGFLVSAAKTDKGVGQVEITARRTLPCQIMHPWPDAASARLRVRVTDTCTSHVIPHEVDASNGTCIVFPAEKGHTYRIGLDTPE